MSKAILGKKLGMTQVFTAEGQLVSCNSSGNYPKRCSAR